MMSRRLVNLAMVDRNNCMFSLHRMDLSKLLFYPSTAEAEAAGRSHARAHVNKQGKPRKIEQLRLPPVIMGFEPYPSLLGSVEQFSECSSSSSMFVLLHGARGLSSEPSRILFSSGEGLATMYDFDSRSVLTVPELRVPGGSRDIPIVTTGRPGAWEEDLYVMCPGTPGWEFKILDLIDLKWKPLPPPPVRDTNISSFAVVDGGRIICVSSAGSQCYGTFCFDTVSQEWWPAGNWVLPFNGRAEHVPELGTWLGFSCDHPHYLCAVDLPRVAMAPRQPPMLKHVCEDFRPPPREDCLMSQIFLVNLGSGRFCVAKVLEVEMSVQLSCFFDHGLREPNNGMLTVLTGVEVIRGGGGDGGELRMVKHKSGQLVHPAEFDVACVL